MSIKTLRKDLSVSVLNSLLANIQNQVDSYYYFIGKTEQWPSGDTTPTSTQYTTTLAGSKSIRASISYLQKVRADEVSLVMPRVDWSSGSTYTPYSTIGTNTNTYITVYDGALYNVFVCIDKTYAATTSMVKPSKSSPGEIRTETDGYTWKHLYTIPKSKQLRFMSASYVPVQRGLSDSFYNKGSLTSVTILNGGSGYTNSANVPLTITGDGTGAAAHAVISGAALASITIVNGGTGYTNNGTNIPLTITGNGIGASAHCTVAGGVVTNVVVDTPGTGYSYMNISLTTGTPTIAATFTPNFGAPSGVTSVVVDTPGSGYSWMNFAFTSGSPTTLAVLSANFGVSDLDSDQYIVEQSTTAGMIDNIEITSGGSGYIIPANINVTIVGDGTGATVGSVITSNGQIVKIQLSNRGSGYSYANVVITDISGTGATAIANVCPAGGHGYNMPLEVPNKKLMISSSIKYEYPFSTINQEFRIFGIIRNPNYISSGNIARLSKEYAGHVVITSGATAVADKQYTDSAGRLYRCTYGSGTDAHFVQEFENFYQPTGTLTPVGGGTSVSISYIMSSPTINKYSGEIIFLSEDAAFQISSSSGAILKTYLQI